MMATVAVVMSTYNGEKYLREQLDSILNQADVAVTLYVRDDGSSDGTKNILSEYAEKNANVHVEFGQNVGVGSSFMNALYSVPDTFDYYSFSDQDDIWLENKLFEAVKLLSESGKSLYASNQECVDKDGKSLGLRWENDDKRIFLTPEGIVNMNVLCGCTMVFTKPFLNLIKSHDKRPSGSVLKTKNHDGWIAAIAAAYESLVYDNRSFIKYRQHGDNVVGAYKIKPSQRMKIWKKKLFDKELRCSRSCHAREMCDKFPEVVDKFPLIRICAYTKTLKNKREIIKHNKELRAYTGESKFVFMLRVYLGLF